MEASEALELQDLEEGAKLRAALLERERLELVTVKKQLEREAHEHFSELQLLQELDAVSEELRNCPSLPESGVVHEPGALSNRPDPGRFVLLDLIGTGGFATVFKAYDLQKHEWVACKLHSVDSSWTEARKNDNLLPISPHISLYLPIPPYISLYLPISPYISCRRARTTSCATSSARSTSPSRSATGAPFLETRTLPRDPQHPSPRDPHPHPHPTPTATPHPDANPSRRIIETSAAFELHNSAFVSVMPYCNGGSLADLLRRNGPLPEKDAKSVIVQVLHGLRHLHGQKEAVIHFDLKPANILFHEGEVKLGDPPEP